MKKKKTNDTFLFQPKFSSRFVVEPIQRIIKKPRWKPKLAESFWYFYMINGSKKMTVGREVYVGGDLYLDIQPVYKTKREAQTALKKLKKFIKEEL